MTARATRSGPFRSVVALVGGFAIYTFLLMLLVLVLTVAVTAMPSTSIALNLIGTLLTTMLAAAAGGYAAAALAPDRRYGHAVVLAAMIVLSSVNAIRHPPAGPPPWFPYVLAAIGVLGAIGGGLLFRPRSPVTPAR
ncbi:MAG: hypothetical protein HY084_14230 [Gemmatimonadetes bacterium]|nr:hypothetical protein [Gemmatimonadota bacterium]